MRSLNTSQRTQRGAVLLVSLVILLILTLFSVSAMQSTTIDMRMAANNQARQQAFQAAEAALAVVENQLQNDNITTEFLQDCASGSSTCYEATCAGALCFTGTYNAGTDQYDCETISGSPPPEKVWRNSALDVWNNAAKHRTVRVNAVDNAIKYIIEFICYTERGDGSIFDASSPNNGVPLFRITTLATSDNNKARIMLQSTYRYNE